MPRISARKKINKIMEPMIKYYYFSLALCFWTVYARCLQSSFYLQRYGSRLENADRRLCHMTHHF